MEKEQKEKLNEDAYRNIKVVINTIYIIVFAVAIYFIVRATIILVDLLDIVNASESIAGITISRGSIIKTYISFIAIVLGFCALTFLITSLISRLYDITYNHEKSLNKNEENK